MREPGVIMRIAIIFGKRLGAKQSRTAPLLSAITYFAGTLAFVVGAVYDRAKEQFSLFEWRFRTPWRLPVVDR